MHILQRKILETSNNCNLGRLSLRRIAKLVGEKHPQKIKFHLEQLERKGLIKHDRGRKEIVNLKDIKTDHTELVSIPILGSANCGEAALFAEEHIEGFLKVSKRILKKDTKLFALKAVGNSMNRATIDGKQIDDGDYIIVDCEARDPSNGDYVVSMIDGLANIKKFFWDNASNQVVLYSESDQDLAPIYIHPDDVDDYLVCGKVMQVFKRPN